MPYEEIKTLAASYPPQPRAALLEFALERRQRQESEVLELAALAAELSVDSIINLGLEPNVDPLLEKAIEMSGSQISPGFFKGLPKEELRGHVSNIKGKYFELLIADRLNAGETVGEIKLLPGQEAILAPQQNTPGWDLKITDKDGEVVEQIQIKATENMGSIERALTQHPDFRVAVPAEVDGIAEEIIQTDISHESLEKLTRDHVEELGESGMTDLLAIDMVPVLPALVITVTEGRAVLTGSATLQMSLQRGAKRLGRATGYNALGMGLSTVIGPAAIPTTMAIRIAEQRFGRQMAMSDFVRSKTEEVMALTGQPV